VEIAGTVLRRSRSRFTGTRRPSIPTDTQLLPLNVQLKIPSQNERRRSLPNISVDVKNGRRNGEVSMLCSNVKKHNDSKFLDYLDIKVNQTVTPSNVDILGIALARYL
jgi:hypothetical protein